MQSQRTKAHKANGDAVIEHTRPTVIQSLSTPTQGQRHCSHRAQKHESIDLKPCNKQKEGKDTYRRPGALETFHDIPYHTKKRDTQRNKKTKKRQWQDSKTHSTYPEDKKRAWPACKDTQLTP